MAEMTEKQLIHGLNRENAQLRTERDALRKELDVIKPYHDRYKAEVNVLKRNVEALRHKISTLESAKVEKVRKVIQSREVAEVGTFCGFDEKLFK